MRLIGTDFGFERFHGFRRKIDAPLANPLIDREIQGVAQPILIVALLEIFPRMRASGFFAGLSGDSGCFSHFKQILHFQSFNTRGIERVAFILQPDVVRLVDRHAPERRQVRCEHLLLRELLAVLPQWRRRRTTIFGVGPALPWGRATAAQVRKDLSLFGSFGKRGLGYAVPELSARLRRILGLDRTWKIALVGAGRVGAALFEYPGFRSRGFRIVSVFDKDAEKIGRRWGDIPIEDVADLGPRVREQGVEILILAVPAPAVQDVVDRAVEAGVRGILNFAPAQLKVPEEVALKDVNMVMELEALSFTLSQGAAER